MINLRIQYQNSKLKLHIILIIISFIYSIRLIAAETRSENSEKLTESSDQQRLSKSSDLESSELTLDELDPLILKGRSDSLLVFEETTREQPRDQDVANLDLDGLLNFAKENNRVFVAVQQNVEIARGDLITAGLLPNPQFYYSQSFIGGIPRSEGGSSEYAPGLSFELDLAGKRGQRKEVAEKGVAIEKFNLADFTRIFKFQLRQTYREYLLLSEQLKYKKEFFLTYLTLMKASKLRAEKGDISGIEYDRLDLERIGYEADYRVTALQLVEVSQRLRRLLGIPPSNSILELKGSLTFVSLSQLGTTQRKIAIDQRPDFAALLTRIEQSDALASLKRREAVPSITLGGEFRKKGDEGYFGFSLSLPIPAFNRNQGEILKAGEISRKLKIEAQIKRHEISAELQNRFNELTTREQMLFKYQELGLLEKNKLVAERARFAYLKKAYSIVALLESQRNYMNVQKNYFEQLYLYYTSIDGFLAAREGTEYE